MAKVTLYSPDMSKSDHVELLVDTGSTYTWVSNLLLKKLNIETRTTRKFKTIDGRLLERRVGEVLIEYMGKKPQEWWFSPRGGDADVLGVDALEGLGLEVDPITKQLRKAEALLAL